MPEHPLIQTMSEHHPDVKAAMDQAAAAGAPWLDILRAIFNSPTTITILQALLALAQRKFNAPSAPPALLWLAAGLAALLAAQGHAAAQAPWLLDRARPLTVAAVAATTTYERVAAQAVREGKPLIIWAGVAPRSIAGARSMGEPQGARFDGPAVIVGVPVAGRFDRYDLPAQASDAAIAATIRRAYETQAVSSVELLPVSSMACPSGVCGSGVGGPHRRR